MALPEPQEELCFSPEELLNSDFQVDDFVGRCRKRVTMEGLREELHSYFKTLKSAMVELINKDYADFVNLSANLAGIDKSIEGIMTPLRQLQVEIKDIKAVMDGAIRSVQSKLNAKSEISEQKMTLRRLIAILESMDRLERLLHIQHSEEFTSEIHSLSQKAEWGPIVMERVAMEFNKLQYNVSLIATHPLIEDSNERIATITHSLQSWLESSFKDGLNREDRGVLISCLQTYTHIGRQEAAEGMFRSTVAHPCLEAVVTTKNLIAHPQGLSGLYAEILTFVPKHCTLLMDVTSRTSPSEGHASSVGGFDFLVNSVWPEIVSLVEQKISVIFAPGNPDTFHQNYTTTMEFVSSFEKLCSTEDSVKRLRAHPSYNAFMSKWSLPVYFQIRFQEIAGSVESSLTLPLQAAKNEAGSDQPLFKLGVFECVWLALQRCWSSDVLLPALVHKFWKLSLQIVMRTALWLEGLCVDQSEALSVDTTPTTSPSLEDCLLVIVDLKQLSTKYQASTGPFPVYLSNFLEGGLDDTRERLNQLIPKYAAQVIEGITAQCNKNIEAVQTIPRLFRRTNKNAPSKPSTYTSVILSPLEQRLQNFPSEYVQKWVRSIVEAVTEKYYHMTSELLLSVKRTEDSLLKLNAYRKSSAPVRPSGGEMSDDNKIRLQVALDIESYSMKIARLDSQCLQLPAVKQLLVMGQTSKDTAMESVQEH